MLALRLVIFVRALRGHDTQFYNLVSQNWIFYYVGRFTVVMRWDSRRPHIMNLCSAERLCRAEKDGDPSKTSTLVVRGTLVTLESES